MKGKTSIILITLLIVLAMSFTQGFAAAPGGKKTPEPGGQAQQQVGQPDKPSDGEKPGNGSPSGKVKDDKGNGSDKTKDNGNGGKSDQAPGQANKPDKGSEPPDSAKAKPVHLRGIIVAVTETSATVKLPNGDLVTLDLSSVTVHIPTKGQDSVALALVPGMQITVKAAAADAEGKTYQAVTINVVPGKPGYKHGAGTVDSISQDGTGTVKVGETVYDTITVDGTTYLIKPGETVFLPKGTTLASIKPGMRITVVSPRDPSMGAVGSETGVYPVAKAVVVLPSKTVPAK